MVQPPWKTIRFFLRKLNTELPFDPAISLPGICSEILKTGTQTNTCTRMFIAALFTTAKRWKCPNVHLRWTRKQKVVYKHKGILFSCRSEGSTETCCCSDETQKRYVRPRSQTRKLCIVRFHVYDVSRQQADQWLPGAGEREEEGGRGSHCLLGVRSPSGSWKPHLVSELGRADGCTTVWTC